MDDRFSKITSKELIRLCKTSISEMISFGLLQINENTNPVPPKASVICERYCVNSTLHRGFYYPSPVYDLIVGNTKRGKVIVQPKATDNITHHYFYDCEMNLFQIDSVYHGKTSYTEVLIRHGNEIIGLTTDQNGVLAAVTKEEYQGNRLRSFIILNCYSTDKCYVCYNYQEEHYYYDSLGLCSCRFIMLSPKSNHLVNAFYEFDRQDGYLTAYMECSGKYPEVDPKRYRITKKRKA